MDFLTAVKQIDDIAAHLLKLGCSPTQIARHVAPLERKYGIVWKPAKRHKSERVHFAPEQPVRKENGFRFHYNPTIASYNVERGRIAYKKHYKERRRAGKEQGRVQFRKLGPDNPKDQLPGVDTSVPPWVSLGRLERKE
jgi:hypothetical protein